MHPLPQFGKMDKQHEDLREGMQQLKLQFERAEEEQRAHVSKIKDQDRTIVSLR
jgi:hypothetical protein